MVMLNPEDVVFRGCNACADNFLDGRTLVCKHDDCPYKQTWWRKEYNDSSSGEELAVICLETGQVWKNATEAADWNCIYTNSISSNCSHHRKLYNGEAVKDMKALGVHFMRLSDYKEFGKDVINILNNKNWKVKK